MAIDFKALGAKAVAEGADQTKSVAGGDYEAPAAGPCLLRFIGYIEIGKQKTSYKGVPGVKEQVELIFELVGKRHPPRDGSDGTKIPHRISVTESYSLNEKANFFKLFQRMNYRQDAQHIVQLLGEGFKGEIIHDVWKGKDGKDRTTAVLRNAAGYTIAPPRKEDEDSETGWVDVAVPPALSELRCFLWQQADLNQWASLFIDGTYPERKDDKTGVVTPGRSKNVFQNKILGAVNFDGSPIHLLLLANGSKIDIPDVHEQDGLDPDDNPEAGAAPAPAAAAPASAPAPDSLGGIV
jgi:hypothetical protein